MKQEDVGNHNYMEHLAPNDRSDQQLESVDQAAMQARNRLRRDDCDGGPCMAEPWDESQWKQRQHDYAAINHVEKRKLRGGATAGKHDLTGNF